MAAWPCFFSLFCCCWFVCWSVSLIVVLFPSATFLPPLSVSSFTSFSLTSPGPDITLRTDGPLETINHHLCVCVCVCVCVCKMLKAKCTLCYNSYHFLSFWLHTLRLKIAFPNKLLAPDAVVAAEAALCKLFCYRRHVEGSGTPHCGLVSSAWAEKNWWGE